MPRTGPLRRNRQQEKGNDKHLVVDMPTCLGGRAGVFEKERKNRIIPRRSAME